MLSTIMVSNNDKWIRIFDIPDVSKHKKGFTIYKIISLLYPESCPDAVTKLTVWKRFNDFKKLHRELKLSHKSLNLKDKYPTLPNSSFFKRFDEDIVEERRQSILIFLEYIAKHSQLFMSSVFVKFFETSHTPIEQLNSNINTIRANLNLPQDVEYVLINSDDEHLSDTESITTLNSFTVQTDVDYCNLLTKSQTSLNRSISQYSKNSDSMSLSTNTDSSIILLDGQIYATPPNTPASHDEIQYIIDASLHINMAIELETNQQYEKAFTAYKVAIDILLKNGKDEKNYDRRQMVRYKTQKYLIRAEKIYNMYLATEVKSLQQISDNKNETIIQRPISDLYKYKVVKIIGTNGMLVQHLELQKFFFIKVIHKTMTFINENLILPKNVPFMVKLINYYNCENALFLILEYCNGPQLWQHITNSNNDIFIANNLMLKQIDEIELSDIESDCSYSDLIHDYTTNRDKTKKDDDFEIIKCEEVAEIENSNDRIDNKMSNNSRRISTVASFDELDDQTPPLKIDDLIRWSAQLLIALEKLHSLGVICCDLQLHNLLINENGDLVLTYMCNINDICNIYCKTMAPEIYSFEPITEAVDWWCFGSILYELLVGIPLSTMHPDCITSSTILKIPKYVSPEARSLLRQLLNCDPKERLGCNGVENLKAHPFFHSVKWDELMAKY